MRPGLLVVRSAVITGAAASLLVSLVPGASAAPTTASAANAPRTAAGVSVSPQQAGLDEMMLSYGSNDLIGTSEIGREGCGHVFRPCVELSEGQGLSSVRNLQGGEMRKLFSGAAEDLCEPPDSFLMRYVYEGAAAEDIRQDVLGGIRLPVRHLLRRPKVPPPSHKCQRKENHDSSCDKSCYQNSPSHARKSRPSSQTLLSSEHAWVFEHVESTVF